MEPHYVSENVHAHIADFQQVASVGPVSSYIDVAPEEYPAYTPYFAVNFQVYATPYPSDGSKWGFEYMRIHGSALGIGDDDWWDEAITVSPDAFAYAVPLWERHLARFDRKGFNDMPRAEGLRLLRAWQRAADGLRHTENPREIGMLLGNTDTHFVSTATYYRLDIARMLKNLVTMLTPLFEKHDEIRVTGHSYC